MAKGKKVNLSNGLELEIKPMTLETEARVGEYYDKEESMKAIMVMVKDAIKSAVPEATDEEINNLNKKDLRLITNEVLKINGLKEDEKKKEESQKSSVSKKKQS